MLDAGLFEERVGKGNQHCVVAAKKLGWSPQLYIASVSIEPSIMAIARANAPELTRGARAIAFVKNPNDPVWRKDPAVALYRSILKRFAPGARATDVYHWYGMTVAWTMVDALERAGIGLASVRVLSRYVSLCTPQEMKSRLMSVAWFV